MGPFVAGLSPLVLGSASPRRREILERLGLVFEVVTPAVDEATLPGERPGDYLPRVVRAKLDGVQGALSARPRHDEGAAPRALLVADTSVILDHAILGKPVNPADARAMVERLGGRTHEVHTRFAIGVARGAGAQALHEETVITEVTFRSFVPGEAEAYAATGEGADKAGGYAVQGLGAAFVSRISGSYTGVVGLPACEVMVALRRLGYLS